MKYNNTKYAILIPVIAAISVVIGMFIAKILSSGQSDFNSSGDKIKDVMDLVSNYYVNDVNRDSIEDIMISDFLHNLDPHSSYMTATESQKVASELTGNFVGIGIRFYVLHDTVLVTNIISGGASEAAGLLPGDRIIDVDGRPISGIGISNDSVRGRILGGEGQIVKLKIIRDGKMMNFDIKRAPVDVESVYSSVLDNRIGYIKITSFNDNTTAQFAAAMQKYDLLDYRSLIIDLRDNSGGFMHAAQGVLSNFFAGKELLVYTEGANSKREDVYSSGKGRFANCRIAVLVNENSASASEITAGVIQDYDIGTVIGNVTFGKGLVQRIFDLSDGSSVRLTVSRYYLPSGRCIQRSYKDGYISYLEQYYANYGKNKQNVDSTKVFYTLKKKRKVYEGDGLMPDITVEHDTSYVSDMLLAIGKTDVISNFCVEYFDANRKKMLAEISDRKGLDAFLEADKMFDKFLSRLDAEGLSYSQPDLDKSRKYLNKVLRYQIASYVLSLGEANAILLEDDPYMTKAMEVLRANY